MKKHFLIIGCCLFFLMSQLVAQTTESYSWNSVNIGGGGFVSGIFFSPIEQNIMYARTDVGGAYRWNEASEEWISLMDWVDIDERGLLGVEALAIDPKTAGTVYMMAGTVYWNQADDGIGRSSFLRSSDYGQTWEEIPVWDNSTKYFNVNGNGMGRGAGERLAIDPANSNTMLYGSRDKGLWKTTDNGDTWSKVSSFPVDTTWNGCGISFVAFDSSTSGASQTERIYVGLFRKSDNLYVSEDAGESWSLVPNRPTPQYATDLMPQRIVIRPDGSEIYTTWGNGAGPHTMQWDEGWGDIDDWFNRGAVFKYELETQTWTDISPQDLIDPEEDSDASDPSTYYGCYSGISIDPNNPDHIVVSSIASYRGPQFWYVDDTWYDEWGDNIFVTEDGGDTWVPSFQYYWVDGGVNPDAEQMDENGISWMIRGTIHWIGSTAIDPFNPQRVFVTSGNGVFKTEDIFNYEWAYEDEWGNADTSYTQYTVWQVASHGIEETVPEEVVSIPDGPLVSVIGDYDGFVHDDITESPSGGRHKVTASGSDFTLGSTTGLAYAPQSGKLAKCAKTRSVSTDYNTISIGPVQWSEDNGETWTTETYTSSPPTDLLGGKVALSADGEITLWMPSEGTTMYRYSNSQWDEVDGISFSGRPVGDQVDENTFYAFDQTTGYMYVSIDKGESFSQAGFAGISSFRNAVATPYNAGHVWVPVAGSDGTGSLMFSSDSGATFSAISGVGYCEAVGFGKAATGAEYPTVFVFAEIDDEKGIWRSIDKGVSWVRINDDDHEYGGLANGEFVTGDMNVFGRVYMSTAGRGIAYGEPTGSTVSVTGISVTPETDTLNADETLQIEATITPSNATNQSVSWNSSNESIASVSSSGLVTGLLAGTTTITATTYDGGYVASCEVTVIGSANTAPVAEITASVSSGSAPLVVSFDASNSYDNDDDELSYLWDFGDGTQSTEVSIEHTFSTKGSYTVLLKVEDSTGLSDTDSVQITVTGDDVTQYTLTTTVSGSGSIELDPSGGTYDSATVVTATAVASSGYHFVSWSGDASGTDATTALTMVADKSITATFEQDSTGDPCDNPDTISVPYSHSGSGEYCFVTSDDIAYVNSWATDKVEINGVDYTNSWIGEMPDAIDGYWYIHFVGSYDWSGLDIGSLKSTTSAGVIQSDSEIQIYPNPFTSSVNIAIADPEQVDAIEVLNNLGRTVLRLSGNQINNFVELGEGLSSGTYYIKVYGENTHQAFIILKE